MIDLPDSATFAAIVSERRFIAAVTIAALSGVVRGFSGFGSAMIYMPLVAAVYDPRVAAITLLLVDLVGSTPFAIRIRSCVAREVLPLSVRHGGRGPIGIWA